MLISWAWQQYQRASEIAVGFAIIAFWRNFSGPAALSVVQIEPTNCQAVTFVFREVQIASHGYQGKQITP